jgi:hypothetical protein
VRLVLACLAKRSSRVVAARWWFACGPAPAGSPLSSCDDEGDDAAEHQEEYECGEGAARGLELCGAVVGTAAQLVVGDEPCHGCADEGERDGEQEQAEWRDPLSSVRCV